MPVNKESSTIHRKRHTPVYKYAALSTPWNLMVSRCTHLFLPPTTLQQTFGFPATLLCQPQDLNIYPEEYDIFPQDLGEETFLLGEYM